MDSEEDTLSENQELTFEMAHEQLGEVVKKLEEGELPLAESVALFEEGMRLERFCEQRLDQAVFKINELTRREGEGAAIEPFEAEDH